LKKVKDGTIIVNGMREDIPLLITSKWKTSNFVIATIFDKCFLTTMVGQIGNFTNNLIATVFDK